MANIKQYYGIKYPFTINNLDNFFVDLNKTFEDKISAEIAHVLLTTKGTRIRMPDFGTNLTKYIFEPNDSETWEEVKNEAISAVNKYVSNASLNDIEVIANEDNNSIFLKLKYKAVKGTVETNNTMAIKL